MQLAIEPKPWPHLRLQLPAAAAHACVNAVYVYNYSPATCLYMCRQLGHGHGSWPCTSLRAPDKASAFECRRSSWAPQIDSKLTIKVKMLLNYCMLLCAALVVTASTFSRALACERKDGGGILRDWRFSRSRRFGLRLSGSLECACKKRFAARCGSISAMRKAMCGVQ